MACLIPIMPPAYEQIKLDYPITPRENLMRAFHHEKPMWMPNLYADSQMIVAKSSRDMAPTKAAAGVDWFGTNYIFSPEVGINMPAGGVFDSVTEWRDKVKWPDLDAIDWSHDADDLVRDESKALYMRMSNGIFERLHAFEPFEQALMDLLLEPDDCRDLFERLADYKISLFNHIRDVFPLDYIVAADDYGTALAPFFSTEVYEDLLLEPTRRFVQAVQARGTKFFAHCCGKVEVFVPYFADDLKVDGIEIQDLNDMPTIVSKYGDRLLIEVKAKPEIVYDDETTDEQFREHIHSIVDTFGAQSNPGSGAVMNLACGSAHGYYLMAEELFRYSKEKYAAVQ